MDSPLSPGSIRSRMMTSKVSRAAISKPSRPFAPLPTDVQRRLFEHSASGKSHDAALLKARIARFLHNHKDNWDSR
jgi:hypothetical protein